MILVTAPFFRILLGHTRSMSQSRSHERTQFVTHKWSHFSDWKITCQLKTKDKRVQGAASKVMKTR
jgi:hypothetical protein